MHRNDNVEFIYERAAFFYNYLLNSERGEYAREYLEHRGIPMTVANNFMLGATSPMENGSFMVNSMTMELSQSISVNDIIGAGLASSVRDEDTNKIYVYDYFSSGRIIIPIIGHGKPVYFSSRTTFKSKVNHKHLSSDGKHNNIFNQDILNTDCKEIYITEGPFDALSLALINKPVIATLGTRGISPWHKELFKNTNRKYIFVFDNDKNDSGDKAVLTSASILKSFGAKSLFKIELPRKLSSDKVDVNQLLCRCLRTGRTVKDFARFFSNLEHKPVDVEAFQQSLIRKERFDDSAQILKVVSSFVSDISRISPTSYRARCPFPNHKDTDPSFVIYTKTNTYKCFGCNEYGGPIRFLMTLLGIDFKEAKARIQQIN